MPRSSRPTIAELERRIAEMHVQPSPSFSWGSIVNLGGIPLITAVVVLAGTWAVNNSTTSRNEAEIKAEKAEREKMRENFFTSQNRLVDVLSKLESRMSVSEKQQELANRQLEKLNDMINTRSVPAPPRR